MGQGCSAPGRALSGGQIAFDIRRAPLGQAQANHFKRAGNPGQQIVEIMGQAAGQLPHSLHLLRLSQRGFRFLPLGQRLRDPRLQRFVQLPQLGFDANAMGHILEQNRNLLVLQRADAKGGNVEMATGSDQFALEVDRLPGAQHAAI